jgi:hypothetical protein
LQDELKFTLTSVTGKIFVFAFLRKSLAAERFAKIKKQLNSVKDFSEKRYEQFVIKPVKMNKNLRFLTKSNYLLRTDQDLAYSVLTNPDSDSQFVPNRLPLVLLCGIRPSCWPPRSTCRRSCLRWAGQPPLAAANWPTLPTKHNSHTHSKKSQSIERLRRKYNVAHGSLGPNTNGNTCVLLQFFLLMFICM